jgi:hypothetical protein
MVTLRTSATVERLDFWRHFDSRATAEEIFCFDLLAVAACLVIGVDLAEDLDIGNLSMVTLRTSATVERLDFLRQFVYRATTEEIFCFDLLAAAASRSAHS